MGCAMSRATVTAGADPARRPRVRRGLALAPLSDGVLIEGGPSRQVLTGTAASSLLPRLLPLLDGQRSCEQIRAQLSLSAPHLDQLLSLLSQRALLEWVRPDRASAPAPEHVTTYLSRTLSVTANRRSTEDLGDELASATVLLAAPPRLAGSIAADLEETGVGTVTIAGPGQLAGARCEGSGRCVAAVYDDQAGRDAFDEFVTACRDRDLPVLRFSGTADTAEIGPVFYGSDTACVACFRRSQEPAEDGIAGSGVTGILAGLVTSALLAMVLGQAEAIAPRRLLRTWLPSMLTDSYDVVPELDCGCCVGGTAPQDDASRDCLAYEWRMGKVPVALNADGAPSPAERQRLAALLREREDLPSAPRHPLPDQAHVPSPGAAYAGGLDESVLAGMLVRTAGFRPPPDPPGAQAASRRWMASGGNMASVTVYLATETGLFGLPGTLFRYDDIGHEVVSIHADRVPLAEVLAGTGLDAAPTDLVIVLTAAVGRLRKKYRDLAWRLAHLDAGCAAMQLRTVAGGYGLRTTFAAAWPAQLGQTLELDPHSEIVTAVAGISAVPAPGHHRAKGSSPCQP
jgi:SagB-type dehydrogenase family enzyme